MHFIAYKIIINKAPKYIKFIMAYEFQKGKGMMQNFQLLKKSLLMTFLNG